MRCSSPGVPGRASARASRSSRAYGQKLPSGPFGSVANPGSIGSIAARSGISQGSAPLAR